MSFTQSTSPLKRRASLTRVLDGLQAASEITRLRILALVAEAELTVSELVVILEQSQPRVSRHLRLLVEAGLVDRHREGAWAFFHIAQSGPKGGMARNIVERIDPADPQIIADRLKLEEVRSARARRAADYFAARADDWNRIRSLHVPEEQVESAILQIAGDGPIRNLLDLGTGTGRMLELLAPQAGRAVGVDLNPAMLTVARASIDRTGLRNVQLRQGDLYALPVESGSSDLVILHQVLHYLDEPARALREAARALAPGGRLIVVDFAPHAIEFLREKHQHRRLGFSADEIMDMLAACGLDIETHSDLSATIPPADGSAQTTMRDNLTISFWVARDPRVVTDVIETEKQSIA